MAPRTNEELKEMKTLHQIIVEKGADYEYESIDCSHLIGMVGGEPRVIRAILDKAAVVHPLNDSSSYAREVRRFEKIMVWERDIVWEPREKIYQLGFTRFHPRPHG